MKRTIPQIPLRRKKGLNRMSVKAKGELKAWLKIKTERMLLLREKFSYLPCEYCHRRINEHSELYCAEGHHNNGNRRQNDFQNRRIVHRVCNQIIEDKNIKDIPSML
jgi:hypothetical protein